MAQGLGQHARQFCVCLHMQLLERLATEANEDDDADSERKHASIISLSGLFACSLPAHPQLPQCDAV